MQRAAQRQAVLVHQPDPLAAGPGQLGGPRTGGFCAGRDRLAVKTLLALKDIAEQPHRAVQVTDVVLDQAEASRRARPGQPGGRRGDRGALLLGQLDDDAVRLARVQEGFLPAGMVQADADRLDAEGPGPGQRLGDVGDEEVEVVRARAAAGQEALEKRGVRPAGGGQQLDLRAGGELQLAPPVPGGVAAVGPGPAEKAAKQFPAVRQGRRADGEVIKVGGHGASR